MTAPAVGEHVELHEVLADLVRDHGAQDVAALAARARRRLRDPRLATELVEETVGAATTLVLLPDGRVEHLGRVLDGIVLTHRVRGALGGRSDLWLGRGAQPFLTLACLHPLPLVSGGEARIASSGAPALVGPPGWLPDVERGDLVGLRWREGRLAVARVDQSHLAGAGAEGHVRTVIAAHCAREGWITAAPEDLAGLMVHCLALARLEDPGLLSTPHAPLEEILDEPAARRTGMSAVYADLERLAQQQGTTSDQLAAAVLAQLAVATSGGVDGERGHASLSGRAVRPRLTVLPGGAAGTPDGEGSSGPPEAG